MNICVISLILWMDPARATSSIRAAMGVNSTGVSQSLNLVWHQPAKIGTRLNVVSTSMYTEGWIRTARVELLAHSSASYALSSNQVLTQSWEVTWATYYAT
ncbi:hypothetical protein D9757_013835 [Collybiopsis confluens]|uniref:Uncharacterized protein n=1 Tax=Collybiopsis confluens TaxID=2823264 RepID=A0A8H5LMS6_9AGAR|nr:hypothetical protein D9757_013835 [Collybiopsis confluens]